MTIFKWIVSEIIPRINMWTAASQILKVNLLKLLTLSRFTRGPNILAFEMPAAVLQILLTQMFHLCAWPINNLGEYQGPYLSIVIIHVEVVYTFFAGIINPQTALKLYHLSMNERVSSPIRYFNIFCWVFQNKSGKPDINSSTCL